MTSEDYHRPPIVALELRSQGASVWRFRIVMAVVMALVIAGLVWVVQAINSTNDGAGTVGDAMSSVSVTSVLH